MRTWDQVSQGLVFFGPLLVFFDDLLIDLLDVRKKHVHIIVGRPTKDCCCPMYLASRHVVSVESGRDKIPCGAHKRALLLYFKLRRMVSNHCNRSCVIRLRGNKVHRLQRALLAFRSCDFTRHDRSPTLFRTLARRGLRLRQWSRPCLHACRPLPACGYALPSSFRPLGE